MSEIASEEKNYLHDLSKRLSLCTTVAERLTTIFENYKTRDKNFTRKYFAKESHVHYQTFCKYLDGTIEVPLRVINMISEKTGISCDLIINGADTKNIRGRKLYGLRDSALSWLIKHKDTAEHEMLNLILSDEDTANTLLSALCLYVQNPTLKISIENADGYADIPNTILLDNHGVLRDVIVDALLQVAENVANLSQKKPANKKA